MLFKILSTMLRDCVAGLVMAVGCCCMMVAQAFVKAAVCLAQFACKVRGCNVMLSKICLVFAVLISIVWMVSLTVLVGCGAVWALQKLGGM